MARTKTVADIRSFIDERLKEAPKTKTVWDSHYSSPVQAEESIRRPGVLTSELSQLNGFFSKALGIVPKDTLEVRQCFHQRKSLGIWKTHFCKEVLPFIQANDACIEQSFNEVCNG